MNEESDLYCFAVGSLPCLDQNWYVNFLRSRLKCRGAKVGSRILSLDITFEATACDDICLVIQRASQGGEVLETDIFAHLQSTQFSSRYTPIQPNIQFTSHSPPLRLCWGGFNMWRMRIGSPAPYKHRFSSQNIITFIASVAFLAYIAITL